MMTTLWNHTVGSYQGVYRDCGFKVIYQLTVLKKAVLIKGEQQGNRIIYRLSDKGQKYARDTGD
jgi:DNA-binding transcriptional regulator PaaX